MTVDYQGSILLVDDEQAILRALQRLLRPMGCNVLIANSGQEGLALLEQNSVDLVISDMRMPEMDGAEFLAHVAEQWPDTDRILLTGFADLESTIEAINKGKISRYLNKPWDDGELLEAVEKSLRARSLEIENQELHALAEQQTEELKALNHQLEDKVAKRTAALQTSQKRLTIAYERITQGYRATVRVFSSLIQRRMKSHLANENELGTILIKMASVLGYSAADIKQIHYAWLLRNVGKVSFADELIDTPFINLDIKAQRQFQNHPLLAHATILTIRPLDLAACLIRQHKELLDGSGYPNQKTADDIDPRAQLLTVVNDYQELVTGMLQKRPYSTDEALQYLKQNAGTQYRKDAVLLLAKLLPEQAKQGAVMQDKAIGTLDMKVGMVLSRDLYFKEDILLLTKGFKLDEATMERIRELELNMDEDFELYVVYQGK